MTTPSAATFVHERLRDRVYKSLRDLILSQAYPPGSKLNGAQLCRNLGVSRTPVWDAKRRLETKGLLCSVACHGVFALNYGVDKVRERFPSCYLPERLAPSAAEHRPIFAVGVARDADRAEHLSRAHSDHVLADALDFTSRAERSPGSVDVPTAPGTAPRARGGPIAAASSGRRWQT